MTALVAEVEVEEYAPLVATIAQSTVEIPELDYRRFYAMMSYSDYVVFEDEVKRGLRSVNGSHKISSK